MPRFSEREQFLKQNKKFDNLPSILNFFRPTEPAEIIANVGMKRKKDDDVSFLLLCYFLVITDIKKRGKLSKLNYKALSGESFSVFITRTSINLHDHGK
jgi:hypothetical protein